MKRYILSLILMVAFGSIAQIPVVSSGKIVHYDNFNSNFVAARNVDVWLPDGYSPGKRYAVLYMQDGQMLFDSTHTWNHQDWNVEKTLTRMSGQGKIKDCIVVGIWNL